MRLRQDSPIALEWLPSNSIVASFGRSARRECLLIAIALNDFTPPLSDDRTPFSSQFVGVGFVVRMVGKVLPQARPVPLEAAQSQMLVQAMQLPLGIGDQILIAQFVEA